MVRMTRLKLMLDSQYPNPRGANDHKAKTVAKAFAEQWIVRFGCPVNLHIDQGLAFFSIKLRSLCSYLGVQRTLTTSYHPQVNALAKRTN